MMIIWLIKKIIVLENSVNNGRISLALLAEKCLILPANLILLYDFEEKIDHFKRNIAILNRLNSSIEPKQLTTISIIIQHLKAH